MPSRSLGTRTLVVIQISHGAICIPGSGVTREIGSAASDLCVGVPHSFVTPRLGQSPVPRPGACGVAGAEHLRKAGRGRAYLCLRVPLPSLCFSLLAAPAVAWHRPVLAVLRPPCPQQGVLDTGSGPGAPSKNPLSCLSHLLFPLRFLK